MCSKFVELQSVAVRRAKATGYGICNTKKKGTKKKGCFAMLFFFVYKGLAHHFGSCTVLQDSDETKDSLLSESDPCKV